MGPERRFLLQDCKDPLQPQWRDLVVFSMVHGHLSARDVARAFNAERLDALCRQPLDGHAPGTAEFFDALVHMLGPVTHRIREVPHEG